MKKRILVSAIAGLALSATAMAAGTSTGSSNVSTSSLTNTYRALKESPLGFRVLVDMSTQGETTKITGYDHTNIGSERKPRIHSFGNHAELLGIGFSIA